MDSQYYRPGDKNGFQYAKKEDQSKDADNLNNSGQSSRMRDEDLIIEDNTIYEIDRECFERLKKQKKRK